MLSADLKQCPKASAKVDPCKGHDRGKLEP